VAFSILALLDGIHLSLPAFKLMPVGNVDERKPPQFDIRQGEQLRHLFLEMMKES
jgi:hypothetical protein